MTQMALATLSPIVIHPRDPKGLSPDRYFVFMLH
jgi:hypothetical protein